MKKFPKGTITWKFNPRFDVLFDLEEVKQMSPGHQDLINRHAYLSTTSSKYVYSIDDSRFTNHSSKNNNIDSVAFPGEIENHGVANRDIEKGEEILVNYRTFDACDRDSKDGYLDT